MTNYERIHTMKPRELAIFLAEIVDDLSETFHLDPCVELCDKKYTNPDDDFECEDECIISDEIEILFWLNKQF